MKESAQRTELILQFSAVVHQMLFDVYVCTCHKLLAVEPLCLFSKAYMILLNFVFV